MIDRPERAVLQRSALAAAVLIAAVLLRSWFFLSYDESYFDSDQAIVGLMAKHLVEGRARPLFFYGQEYMLAVEAWAMAPVFALLGPTVLRTSTAAAVALGALGVMTDRWSGTPPD